jgi:hypothetical protein
MWFVYITLRRLGFVKELPFLSSKPAAARFIKKSRPQGEMANLLFLFV